MNTLAMRSIAEPDLDEPPEAGDLGVDVAGLPPRRARLVRFVAWLEHCRTDLRQLEQGRQRFLEGSGVAVMTEQRLEKLIREDETGLLSWMRDGATDDDAARRKKLARSSERERLEKQLVSDRHKAEVARAAMTQADAEIDALERQITALESRHKAEVVAFMLQYVDDLASTYRRLRAELRKTTETLIGVSMVIPKNTGLETAFTWIPAGGAFDERLAAKTLSMVACFRMPYSVADNPGATLNCPIIEFSQEALFAASHPWRTFFERLLVDPKAEMDLPAVV